MARNNDNYSSQCPGQIYLDDAEAVACVIVFAPPSRHGPLQTGPKTYAGTPTQHIVSVRMAMTCT